MQVQDDARLLHYLELLFVESLEQEIPFTWQHLYILIPDHTTCAHLRLFD